MAGEVCTQLHRETSEDIDHSWFSRRQIQYGIEKVKYLLYQVLSEVCTYALPPTSLMFIMKTNCLFALFRSCDSACADFRGNNKCTLSYLLHFSCADQLLSMKWFYFFFVIIHRKTRFVSLSSLIHRVLSFVHGEAALKPPVCPFNHRLLCHLSSAVRAVIERLPSGRLFVFSPSIKL